MWYQEGKITAVKNSSTIIGTGTEWVKGARAGEEFQGPDGRSYEIANIASDTALSIRPPYRGSDIEQGSYVIIPIQGYTKILADRAAKILDDVDESIADANQSVAKAKTQADRSELNADESKSARDVVVAAKAEALVAEAGAVAARDAAVAVTTGGTATIEPEAGKIPLAGAEGTIKQAWVKDLEFELDALRVAKNQLKYGDGPYPITDFQFAGARYLDPRIDFTRASADWGFDETGTYRKFEIDEPVLDYDPVTGEAEGLRTWGQRTNLIRRSEETWLYPWRRTTADYGVSEVVDFVPNMGEITVGFHYPQLGKSSYSTGVNTQQVSLSAGTHTLSAYLKARGEAVESMTVRSLHRGVSGSVGTAGSLVSRLYDSGDSFGGASDSGSGVFGSSTLIKCEPIGNNWFSYVETFELLEDAEVQIRLFPYEGANSFTGDGEMGIMTTRFQLEGGGTKSGYIPTFASAVTVAATEGSVPLNIKADSISMMTEFTFLSPAVISSVTGVFGITNTAARALSLTVLNNSFRVSEYTSSTETTPLGVNAEIGRRYKLALSYTHNGRMVLAIDGEIVLDAAAKGDFDVSGASDFALGTHRKGHADTSGGVDFSGAVVYHRELSNAQLIALTS